ncbi:riboflavin synthase [Sediminibacterium sp.]|uniref:riboflavin synthase n=1 Tax=Sediminibacterium sp. TaxID=1917865 RepID=UPI003F72EDF1
MFTGIIETIGTVESVVITGSNYTFQITSSITNELKVDQSVSHDGVCLTVEAINNSTYQVTAIAETIQKTNLQLWKPGTKVNIERCMVMNGRLDGHIVQGHVDCTATCVEKEDLAGSWEYRFVFPEQFAPLVIEKGSISVNGTSLTCFNITNNSFTVAIIPYTYHHTSIQQVQVSSVVNIEFDLLGKYVQRSIELRKN